MDGDLIHGGDIYSFREEKGRYPLDFSANTNPLGPPEGIKWAIAQAAAKAGRYPDPLCRELCAAIAESEGTAAGSIFCSNGAADIIYRLTAAKRPKRALLVSPCFAEYELALKSAGCGISRLYTRPESRFDLDEGIFQALEDDIDMLFLCNPNNPTGRLIDSMLLSGIVSRCAEKGIFLAVDECFLGFCGDYEQRSLKKAAAQSGSIMVINAFTKLYGMAGVRLGWCVCGDGGLLSAMRRAGQPWAVSSLAQAAGVAALKDAGYLGETRALIRRERVFLAERLRRLGFAVIDGAANFLLFYSGDKNLAKKLAERSILIRDCSNFEGLGPGWFRTAVKTHEQNIRLIEAMAAVLEGEQ